MNKRVKSINEYYENLEYDYQNYDKATESLKRIHYLSSNLSFMQTDNFSHRFLKIASIMEVHLDLFMSVSEHVDSVPSIIDYLCIFGAKLKQRYLNGKTNIELFSTVINILLTLYYIYQEHEIQQFLENIFIGIRASRYYECKRVLFTCLQVEIILLEDSDLHAVISYLKFERCVSCLKQIWVQKSIIHIFMWHFNKNVGYLNVPIHIFESKQELLPSSTSKNTLHENITVNVTSIWSEDVIAATNLARSLNQHVIFINTHMDVCPIVTLQINDIFLSAIIKSFNLSNIDQCENSLINPTTHEDLAYDLFYDGMWQKPKNNTYWIHKNILFANATSQDIKECIKSATRGFKNLSTMSIDSRRQMLSKFTTILECHGQFSLSKVVSKWINTSYIYGKVSYSTKTERFDVSSSYKPINIDILYEEDEITLFQYLTQNLIIGNSVIVICNPDLCILAPYCNMFKMCGIPPGVINLLSTKDAKNNITYNNGRINNVTDAMVCLTTSQHILISRK